MKNKYLNNTKWLVEQREQKLRQIDWYLSKGWAVFPVGRDKKPLIPNGCRGATTDREKIHQWWHDNPYANVAIATGRKSQLVVIDIDCKNGKDGLTSLDEAYAEFLEFDAHRQLVAVTPTNGFHLYYQWDERVPVTVAAGVLPGIDIRGEGGYVLAPPSSFNIEGKWSKYRWHDRSLPVPALPAWAIDLCEQTRKPSLSTPSSNAFAESKVDLHLVLTGIQVGKRDDQIFRYACHLRGVGVDYCLALGFIKEAAARCIPPFPEAIAVQKVDYAYRDLELNLPLTNEE